MKSGVAEENLKRLKNWTSENISLYNMFVKKREENIR